MRPISILLAALLAPLGLRAAPLPVLYNGWMQGGLRSPIGGNQAHSVAMVRAARAEAAGLVVLSSGNMLGPSATSEVDGGRGVVELMELAGYDAMAVGPHDLFQGAENLLARAGEADFPFVWTNLDRGKLTGDWSRVVPSTVVEREGRRVLVVGLISPKLLVDWPGWPRELGASDPVAALEALAAQAEGVDHVVALTTMNLAENSQLMMKVPWIDVIVSQQLGDDAGWDFQTAAVERADGRKILWTFCYGTNLGRVDLSRSGSGRLRAPSYLLPVAEATEEHPGARALIARLEREADAATGEAIAELSPEEVSDFPRRLLDALRAELNAEVALIHTGAIKAEAPDAALSKESIRKAFPFPDRVARLHVKGSVLRGLWSRRNDPIINNKGLTFAGIEQVGDKVAVNGRRLRDDDAYRVATVEYLALGALGLLPRSPKAIRPRQFVDVVADHFARPAPVRGRMVARVADKPVHRIKTNVDASYSRLAFGDRADQYQFQDPGALFTSSEIPGLVGFENKQTALSILHERIWDEADSDTTLRLTASFTRINVLKLADKAEMLLRREAKALDRNQGYFGEYRLTGTVQDPNVVGRDRPLFGKAVVGQRWQLGEKQKLLVGAGAITRFSSRSNPTDAGLNLGYELEAPIGDDSTFDLKLDSFTGVGGDRIRSMDLTGALRTEITRGLGTVIRFTRFRWKDKEVGVPGTRTEFFVGLTFGKGARRY